MGHFLRPEGGRHARTPACHRNRRARRIGERIVRAARGEGAPGAAPGPATAERASARNPVAAVAGGHASALEECAFDALPGLVTERDEIDPEPAVGDEPTLNASARGSVIALATGAGSIAFVEFTPEPARGPFRIERASFAGVEPDGSAELDGDGAFDAAELRDTGDAPPDVASADRSPVDAPADGDVAAAGFASDDDTSLHVTASRVATHNFSSDSVASECVASFRVSPGGDPARFGFTPVARWEQD